MSNMKSARIVAAEKLATEKHEHQRRRAGGAYLDHVFETGDLASNIGKELISDRTRGWSAERHENLRLAGILHDTIEDTNTSYDTILEVAGAEVAILVSMLTNDKRLPRQIRRRQSLLYIAGGSLDVQIVKLADVLSNLRGLKGTEGTEWIRQFIVKCEEFLDILRSELGKTSAFREAAELIELWKRRVEK